MKVLVCGSREWMLDWPIRRELAKLPANGTIIVHGAARGADSIAGVIAREFKFEVRVYPIPKEHWAIYGLVAGHMRNARMIEEEHPDKDGIFIDKGLAFTVNLIKGTKNMVGKLYEAKIPCEVFAR
jgi:hypothetical protein